MQTPTEVSTGEAKHDSSASRLEMVKPPANFPSQHESNVARVSWWQVHTLHARALQVGHWGWSTCLAAHSRFGSSPWIPAISMEAKLRLAPWTTNLHAHLGHVSLFWTTSLESLRCKGPCWAARSICGWRGGPFCFSTVYQVAEITKGCLEVIDRWQSSLKPEIFGNIWEYRACNLTVLESCSPFFTSSNKAQWQIRAKARLLEQAVERCPVMSDTLRPC